MKNQGGFIGSLIFLVFIIGLVVIMFAGRVIYNNYQNQSEKGVQRLYPPAYYGRMVNNAKKRRT